MKAWDPVFLQLLMLWAGYLLIAALGTRELWTARGRLRADGLAAAAVFAAALAARVWGSPWAVLHVNAHGYEYLRSAFSLRDCFYNGAGYCAFFHPATAVLGRSPDAVFAANAALGALGAALLIPIGRLLLGAGVGPWAAALAYALFPPAWRLGGTEDMFPLAVTLALGSLWAWLAALRDGGLPRFVLAAACLSASLQTRPDLAGWTGVLALCLPLARRPWRETLRGAAAGALAFALLAGPWAYSLLAMLTGSGGPQFLRFHGSVGSRDIILLDPTWTAPLLWLLSAAGVWRLWRDGRRVLLLLAAGIPLACWQVLAVNSGELDRLRLQSPSWPLAMLLAGAGAAWVEGRLPQRWRGAALALLAALLAAGALTRAPLSRQSQNAQLEYAFLRRALPGLPPDATIIMPDRFMAGGVLSTEFPDWWLAGRRLIQASRFLADPQAAAEPRLSYFGLSCQTFTTQSDTYWPQGVNRPEDTPPVPEALDWDLFIGPAPMRPYHPSYHPFKWRGWWDFGCGALGDMGCHGLDPIFRALKLKYPTSVQAVSSLVNQETYPLGSMVHYDFPERENMPPVILTWYDGGLRPPIIPELEEGEVMGTGGVLYIGEKGKILGTKIYPRSLRESYKAPAPYIPSSPGHEAEWIQACKGGKPAGSNFDWAGPLTETVLLGNICLRKELREKLAGQVLKWNPENNNFPNLPEADQFLHYQYREGWSL